ncbi:hypothetical protein SORBI_3001G160300 [Sorghum bicolor]|uniref:Uncharacterized protein n=1 Tax=Sorghum bicolor TaxID=4558 RepID=A0A1B6QJ73_SORBI|nr:hypothetical protein SORBI_3001G160300 [Sorghum bicolor]
MVGPARCRRGWSGVQAFPVGLHPASSSTHAATAGGRRPGLPNRTHCLCCYLMDRCQRFGFEERGDAYLGHASHTTQNRSLVCAVCWTAFLTHKAIWRRHFGFACRNA